MRQHNIHSLLCEKHLASQISECPVCVREERDMLLADVELHKKRRQDMRDAPKQATDENDKLRQAVRCLGGNMSAGGSVAR